MNDYFTCIYDTINISKFVHENLNHNASFVTNVLKIL